MLSARARPRCRPRFGFLNYLGDYSATDAARSRPGSCTHSGASSEVLDQSRLKPDPTRRDRPAPSSCRRAARRRELRVGRCRRGGAVPLCSSRAISSTTSCTRASTDPPRRLTAFERDAIAQAAADEAAREVGELPFRIRPGLVAEMLRFYDHLRRQSQQRRAVRGAHHRRAWRRCERDRGAERLLAQTRFLGRRVSRVRTARRRERRVRRARAARRI